MVNEQPEKIKKPRKVEDDKIPQLRILKAIRQLEILHVYPTTQRIAKLTQRTTIKINSHLTYLASQGYVKKKHITKDERSKSGIKKCIWRYELGKHGLNRYRYLLTKLPDPSLTDIIPKTKNYTKTKTPPEQKPPEQTKQKNILFTMEQLDRMDIH